jgi:cell division septal protein FtsQ
MMRQQHNNTPSQDRHDDEDFENSSLQLSDVMPSERRLRAPLWKKLRGFCMLLIFLGAVELGAASLTASHFDIQSVRIEGLSATAEAPVQKISQSLIGQNWFRADKKSVIRSIEKIPTVGNVRVKRIIAWPPQMKVIVQERQAIAVIGGGNLWWKVDAHGIPYQTISAPDAASLNAITGPDFHLQLGKAMPETQWQQITQLLNAMRADQQSDLNGFRLDLRRVYFDRNGNVSLRLKDAPHQELLVQIGADQWQAKLQRARLALAYLDKKGQRVKVLNLVSYKLPTWIPMQSNIASVNESNAHPSA